MPSFDPNAKRENTNQGIPPGDYIVAIRDFDYKESKKGKPYLACKMQVIAGAAKGKKFRDIVSLDIENEGTAFRLSLLLQECGVTSAIELDDEKAVREAIVNQPFKVRLSRKHENGYVNNGIERYLTGNAVTDADRAAMEEWVVNLAAEDDWNSGSSSGGGRDDVPHASTTDDIPF